MRYLVEHFINGKFFVDKSAKHLKIFNPALGDVIGEVAIATEKEINQTVTHAVNAFHQWSMMTPLRRARVLFRFRELLEKNSDELAAIVTRENGKTLEDAKGSIARAIELVEFACGMPNLLRGSFSENVGTNVDSYTIRQPLGVCVGVTPFNFPVMVPVWMFAQAIACGNTFILKPSEKDPSAPLYLAKLLQQAGLPDGVFSILNGDKTVVDHLLHHPDVAAVSCVGSTPVAKTIYEVAVTQGKRAQAFGGAKNHCVVMPDADLAEAASAITGAAYGSAGERCMALSAVIVIGDETANQLISHLQTEVKKLQIGPGTENNIQMGPLVTAEHLARVNHYIQVGEQEGAKLLVDGRQHAAVKKFPGFYLGPSLFDRVKPEMRIYQEEIFGPVLCVLRVKDFNEALQLVNEHTYGNGTALFTRDGEVARQFATQVQVGMVGINVPIPVPVAYHTFGGWKQSVFGDIPLHADESLRFYTKSKTVTLRWPKGKLVIDHFKMTSH